MESNQCVKCLYYYYGSEDQSETLNHRCSFSIPQQANKKTEFSLISPFKRLFTGEYSVDDYPSDGKFIDKDFPPTKETIFQNEKNKVFDIKWIRAETLNGSGKIIETDKISPGDIKQGKIGNCWFVAALSCLSEKPEMIMKLFVAQNPEEGRYTFRFFKQGLPVNITVDSLIPVSRACGEPFGSSSQSRQPWVALAEKAYAKLHGGYAALVSGECQDAFDDLSGCPSDLVRLDALERPFEWLQQNASRGDVLLAAAIDGSKAGHGEAAERREGLLVNHAYSLVDAKTETRPDGGRVELVQLRNPWSQFEWNGAYSDRSALWSPEMKRDVHLCADENDGLFWMAFDDFKRRFDVISFCDCSAPLQRTTIPFEFRRGEGEVQCPHFAVSVPPGRRLEYAVLHQKDARMPGAKEYIDLSAFVTAQPESSAAAPRCLAAVRSSLDRHAVQRLGLGPGEYCVVPYTSGAHFGRGASREVSLSLYTAPGEVRALEFGPSGAAEGAAEEVRVAALPHNAEVQKEARLVCLRDMGAAEEAGGGFAVKSFVNGGLVLFGLERSGGKEEAGDGRLDVVSDLSRCVNLTPTLDSLQQSTKQRFSLRENDVSELVMLGSMIRRNRDKCHFNLNVMCAVAHGERKDDY